MTTREPTPPPPMLAIDGFRYAEYVLLSAMSWRKRDKCGDPLAEAELSELRDAIDMLENKIRRPSPTSPPPRKQ
jgi:hypothetical protein